MTTMLRKYGWVKVAVSVVLIGCFASIASHAQVAPGGAGSGPELPLGMGSGEPLLYGVVDQVLDAAVVIDDNAYRIAKDCTFFDRNNNPTSRFRMMPGMFVGFEADSAGAIASVYIVGEKSGDSN